MPECLPRIAPGSAANHCVTASRNPNGQVMALSRRVEPEAVSVIEPIVADRIWLEIASAGGTATDALGAVWPSVLDAAARRA